MSETHDRPHKVFFFWTYTPIWHLSDEIDFISTVAGDSFISLSYLFRVGDNTIRKIVLETCEAIYEELKDEFLKVSNFIFKLAHQLHLPGIPLQTHNVMVFWLGLFTDIQNNTGTQYEK